MQEMPGWACVYALDRSLVLFIGKFILFTKKFLERKALPVSDAVLGVQSEAKLCNYRCGHFASTFRDFRLKQF
jgi:hypothetical protein